MINKAFSEKLKLQREASAVKRCHNMPWHGDYTIGQHSFDMLMIYLALCSSPKMEVVKAISYHDMAERFIGDVPYPMKAANPRFHRALARVERRIEKIHGWYVDLDDPEDRKWLHATDMLEFFMACIDQQNLGNLNVLPAMKKVQTWWGENQEHIPQELQGPLHPLVIRLPDTFPDSNDEL